VFVRTGYHTQVPEISSKLNGKKSAFTWATSLRSLGAEQLEPPLICSATVKRLMVRDHETTRADEQSALAPLSNTIKTSTNEKTVLHLKTNFDCPNHTHHLDHLRCRFRGPTHSQPQSRQKRHGKTHPLQHHPPPSQTIHLSSCLLSRSNF
jgi:hypothetical protein